LIAAVKPKRIKWNLAPQSNISTAKRNVLQCASTMTLISGE
jgi:hypothetical protein